MIDHLLILLIIAAAIQPTREGRAAACTFAGLTVAFDLVRVPAEYYHLAAAATDGLCALILARIGAHSGIIRELQHLCLLSIVLNMAGYVAYEMYLPSWPYRSAFAVFYFITIMSLLTRRIGDADGTTNTYRPWFPVNFNTYDLDNSEH